MVRINLDDRLDRYEPGDEVIEIPSFFGHSNTEGFTPRCRTGRDRSGQYAMIQSFAGWFNLGLVYDRKETLFSNTRGGESFYNVVYFDGSRAVIWKAWLKPVFDIEVTKKELEEVADELGEKTHQGQVLREMLSLLDHGVTYNFDQLIHFNWGVKDSSFYIYVMYSSLDAIRRIHKYKAKTKKEKKKQIKNAGWH